MENEFTDEQADLGQGILYYPGDGQFYSAQIARSLSLTGAQGISGPGGPGPHRAHHGHHHGGSAWRGAAINGHVDAATMADDAGAGGGDYSSGNGGGAPSSLPGLLEDIYNFFDNLFGGGGGPSLPPNYFVYKARMQRGKRHPLYTSFDGIPPELVTGQGSTDGSLPTKDEDIEPSSANQVAIVGALEIAGEAEVLGGGPEDPVADAVAVGSIAVGGAIASYEAFQFYAKGGKQNIRDTGLAALPDSEIIRRAHDPSLPPQERQRYRREEKARKERNERKRR